MLLENVTNRGAMPALIQTLSYTEARHQMIAENVANWQTPGYKAKQLDERAFQKALRAALNEKGSDPSKRLVVSGHEQFETMEDGGLRVTPTDHPTDQPLFHDGTNASIDRMMSDLADNAMVHQAATTLLKGRFDSLQKAIRGSV